MDELERIKKKHSNKKVKKYNLNKLLFVIVLTLTLLIGIKSNATFKEKVNKYLFEENIPFSKINKLYQKYFGNFLPLSNEKVEEVFNESLTYKKKTPYKDGVELEVSNNYLVPIIKPGLVVFIGDKDTYQNTVIIQGTDGVDIWYSNITNISVKLYDYVSENTYIGNTINNKLYLIFKKDGEFISYEKYL